MEIAKNLMIILLTGILTENFILCKFYGICPFLGVSKTSSGAVGMGLAVTFVMVGASAVTYPIYHGILIPLNITYLNTICFILVIAAFVQIVEMVLKKYIPPLYKSLGVYLPLITTNCAVLGAALLSISNGYTFLQSVIFGFSAAVGFMVAVLIFAGIREKLRFSNVPKSFQGMPIALVAAGLVAMVFSGFSGISL